MLVARSSGGLCGPGCAGCLDVCFIWFRLSESETMTVLLHHTDTVLDTHASPVSRCSRVEKEAEIQDD